MMVMVLHEVNDINSILNSGVKLDLEPKTTASDCHHRVIFKSSRNKNTWL